MAFLKRIGAESGQGLMKLTEGGLVIGRSPNSDLFVQERHVAHRHAEIREHRTGFDDPYFLSPGDRIGFVPIELVDPTEKPDLEVHASSTDKTGTQS